MVCLKMISELLATVPKGTQQRSQSEDHTFESETIQVCPSGWSFVSGLLAAVR